MAPRSIATATISFGLVSIPIKLYSTASASAGVHFNLVHAKCGTRIKQQYYCPTDEEVVPYGELVRGYEFAKNKYVTFTTEELDAIEAQSTQEIEITEFLPEDQVDSIYFDKSYYLGPDKGGDRAYRLLSAALRKTKRIAIAKYAARGKMYLVALLPKDNGLLMQQLHYADEVKDFADVPRPTGTVDDAEMTLALKLIDQGAAKTFNPAAYHDEVKDRLSKLVDKKVAGEDITEVETEAPRAKVVDLMQALRESLEKKGVSMPDASEKKGVKRAPVRKAAAKKTSKKA